jgi:hypothetical protein
LPEYLSIISFLLSASEKRGECHNQAVRLGRQKHAAGQLHAPLNKEKTRIDSGNAELFAH